MGRRPTALPPDLPTAFRTRDALTSGVPRGRLERHDLTRPHRGVRARQPAADRVSEEGNLGVYDEAARERHLLRVREYHPVMPARAYLCGISAAAIWRIPLPPWVSHDHLHIGVPRPDRAPRRPGVVGYQHSAGFVHVADVEGIRVTDPASTWATLGGLLRDEALTVAADHVLHIPRMPGGFRSTTERALATREQLTEMSERKGRPGAPRLRRALELARSGSASPPETRIRLLIRDANLPHPVLDHDVYDAYGRFLGCSELAYPERKIAIEYESDGHLRQSQLRRDVDKYQSYAEAGWLVVRLTSVHVYTSPHEAIRRIRHALAARS